VLQTDVAIISIGCVAGMDGSVYGLCIVRAKALYTPWARARDGRGRVGKWMAAGE
jgi:hypothetical protein